MRFLHGFNPTGISCLCVTLKLALFLLHSKAVASNQVGTTETPRPHNVTVEATVKSELTTVENSSVGSVASKILNINEKGMVEGNSSISSSNSSNSNYIIEYKPLPFDSPDDIKTQQEWGGNCTLAHWDSCKVLHSWFGNYKDPKDGEIKEYRIDCNLEAVLCLTNGWSVTRCNLLCMSRCNREIQFRFDKYVSHSGECQAHSHG